MSSTPPPANAPSYVAPTYLNSQRICLASGSVYQVPPGWYTLFDIGPFLQVEQWDPNRLTWGRPHDNRQDGLVSTFYSDGTNVRVVNSVNCAIAVENLGAGHGYDITNVNPPTLNTNLGPTHAHAQFRLIVGGAITLSVHPDDATTHNQGMYHAPTVVFDLSQQTPPFRLPQVEVKVVSSTGAINTATDPNTGNQYGLGYSTGNDQGNLQPSGSVGAGQYTWTGGGLNAATLSAKIIPHPWDVANQLPGVPLLVPRLVVNAAPDLAPNGQQYANSGRSGVTYAECIDHGGPVGDYSFNETGTVIVHKGGSGFSCQIAGNFYITNIAPGVKNGSNIPDWTLSGGQYGSVVSGSTKEFPPIFAYQGNFDDEISRQRIQIGYLTLGGTYSGAGGATPSSGTAPAGKPSAAKIGGGGPGFQYRPILACGTQWTVPTDQPKLQAVLGAGNDYFSIMQLGGAPTSWDWTKP